jgi:hypothetical protein
MAVNPDMSLTVMIAMGAGGSVKSRVMVPPVNRLPSRTSAPNMFKKPWADSNGMPVMTNSGCPNAVKPTV